MVDYILLGGGMLRGGGIGTGCVFAWFRGVFAWSRTFLEGQEFEFVF